MKTHLIGLCGLAGAGKDTVADILVKHAGFEKMAFADALRGEICTAYGVSLEVLTDRATKEWPDARYALIYAPCAFSDAVWRSEFKGQAGPDFSAPNYDVWLRKPRSPRQIMQLWGTEYRRAQDPHYWTRALLARLLFRAKEGQTRIVVTDVRFPNEAALIRERAGVLWQIRGHMSAMRGAIMTTAEERKHVSEVDGSAFDPDRVLMNIGSIAGLENMVRVAFLDTEWPAP